MTPITYTKTKTILLSLGALLIGGLGCSAIDATNVAIESAQHNKAAATFKNEQIQHLKEVAAAAEKGDSAAMTELGIAHLNESPFLVADKQKGKTLIEQAANQGYAGAEYFLGIQLARTNTSSEKTFRVMIPGNFMPDITGLFTPEKTRAERYLKQSAQHACTINFTEPVKDGFSNTESNAPTKLTSHTITPALFIGYFYQPYTYASDSEKLLEPNNDNYVLWFARSILHCNTPKDSGIGTLWNTDSDKPEDQIQNLALYRLVPVGYWSYEYEHLIEHMQPEDIKKADIKAQALRQAVKQSELEFPAPKMDEAERKDLTEKGKAKLKASFEKTYYGGSIQDFMDLIGQFVQYDQHLQDFSTEISQYTNSVLIKSLKKENGADPSPEKMAAAKDLLNFYIDHVFPALGKNPTNDHLFVASTGLIISVQTKDTAIANKIFNQLLGGKSFNINQISNNNLVYNIACYYAINHRKSDLLKAAKKLAETPQQVDRILADEDLKDYVNDADVRAALGH